MSAEQRTPEEELILQHHAENVSIVEKLLGWKRAGDPGVPLWLKPATATRREEQWYTSSFDTWADAGLILDVLQGLGTAASYRALKRLDGAFYNCQLTPAAIRAAALDYVRSLPCA